MPRANIFLEHESWRGPLQWSAALHLGVCGVIVLAALFAGHENVQSWGENGVGAAMGATLVAASVPLPASPVETQNLLANQSQGLTQSQPQAAEQSPQALPVLAPPEKPKPRNSRARPRTPPPPPPANTVPYGEGGPVSGPYTVFSIQNMQGGVSFGGNGDFGRLYGWYVEVVRRKVSENWLKYEVDPSITAARRVYLTFDILRDGSPENVQVEESSGVPSLDQSAVRAIERIDTFGPLPAQYSGNKVSVEFWFDYRR